MEPWEAYVLSGMLVALVAAWAAVRRVRPELLRSGAGQTPRVLEEGWQFYSMPTTLEPPGTVFRIDAANRRYIVDTLPLSVQSGPEASGRHEESVTANMGVLARFLRLKATELKVGTGKAERIVFEMRNATREYVEDADLDPVIDGFLRNLRYRVDNRYFIIRACRAATEITYHFDRSQVDELGGEASLADLASAKGTIFTSNRAGEYRLQEKFAQPMRVMFLPEEIRPVTAGLAGDHPELGLVPVREPLAWDEAEERADPVAPLPDPPAMPPPA